MLYLAKLKTFVDMTKSKKKNKNFIVCCGGKKRMQIYLGAIEVEQILFFVLYTKCFTIKNQDA